MTEPNPSAGPRDEELLLDLLTGFLEPAQAAELEARLSVEPELQALRERLQGEQEVLQAALAPEGFEEVPAGLSDRVLAGFAASEHAPAAASPAGAGPQSVSGPRVLVGRSGRASGAGRRWALLAAALFVTGGLVALNALPRADDPSHPKQVMNRQVRTSELLALGILPEAPQ